MFLIIDEAFNTNDISYELKTADTLLVWECTWKQQLQHNFNNQNIDWSLK